MQRLGLLQLGVDLEQLGVGALAATQASRTLLPDLAQALGVDPGFLGELAPWLGYLTGGT